MTFGLLLLIGPIWIIFALIIKWTSSSEVTNPFIVMIINVGLFVIGMAIITPSKDSPGLIDITNMVLTYMWYLFPLIVTTFITIAFMVMSRLYTVSANTYRTIVPKSNKSKKEKKPSALKLMYQSWREKYCAKIIWK
jgi:phosphate/sulfate permease